MSNSDISKSIDDLVTREMWSHIAKSIEDKTTRNESEKNSKTLFEKKSEMLAMECDPTRKIATSTTIQNMKNWCVSKPIYFLDEKIMKDIEFNIDSANTYDINLKSTIYIHFCDSLFNPIDYFSSAITGMFVSKEFNNLYIDALCVIDNKDCYFMHIIAPCDVKKVYYKLSIADDTKSNPIRKILMDRKLGMLIAKSAFKALEIIQSTRAKTSYKSKKSAFEAIESDVELPFKVAKEPKEFQIIIDDKGNIVQEKGNGTPKSQHICRAHYRRYKASDGTIKSRFIPEHTRGHREKPIK